MAHRIAPEVECDLDDIWLYVATESGNMAVANRLVDSITDRFPLLAGFPYTCACSINSPRSACSMPLCTSAIKRD
jgi:plasmid stabilization system protein ParE